MKHPDGQPGFGVLFGGLVYGGLVWSARHQTTRSTINFQPSTFNQMTIALIGSAGQLGADLVARLGDDAVPLTHSDIEIRDAESVTKCLEGIGPQTVINCAAYNFVDAAEQEPEAALAVNAIGPLYLARYCVEHDLTLVHVSTDYVFGADAERETPYAEDDPPGPLSVYGTSKLAGEALVAAYCPRHFIVRTCGLYGQPGPQGKGNFVRTMLRLAATRDELRVVADQHCTPTSTADVSDAIATLIGTEEYGLYHATNAGETTWYEFAAAIFELARVEIRLSAITSAEFGAPARRPSYSVLNGEKLIRVIGTHMRPWREALAEYVGRISNPSEA